MIPHASVTPVVTQAPQIPRAVVLAGPGLVGAAAAVASFKFTAEFGRHNAWPGLSSYLLPATVDGLAVVAWWKAAFGHGGKLAWACGWGTTAVSVAANAAGHAGIKGEAWTIVAGGWPALCLALMVHLLWFPTAPIAPAVWAEAEDPAPPVTEVVPEFVALRGPEPEPVTPLPAGPARGAGSPPWPDASGLLHLLSDSLTEPDSTPVMDATARALMAVGMTDAVLAAHAKGEGVTAVLKLRKHYDLSHDRARAVNRLIFPKDPSAGRDPAEVSAAPAPQGAPDSTVPAVGARGAAWPGVPAGTVDPRTSGGVRVPVPAPPDSRLVASRRSTP